MCRNREKPRVATLGFLLIAPSGKTLYFYSGYFFLLTDSFVMYMVTDVVEGYGNAGKRPEQPQRKVGTRVQSCTQTSPGQLMHIWPGNPFFRVRPLWPCLASCDKSPLIVG